jgi:probable HAF family extracellular repeat protein
MSCSSIRSVTAVLTITFELLFTTIALAKPATFTGLGDLPGGLVMSYATDISADGSIVIGYSKNGYSQSYLSDRAFRWTRSSGLVALPGSNPSYARAITSDGRTIIGDGYFDLGNAENVIRSLVGQTVGQPWNLISRFYR